MQQNAPFTVKHVMPDGATALFPASSVIAVPVRDEVDIPEGIAATPQRIEFHQGDGSGVRASINSGFVYVMNQNGRTIDTFRFPFTGQPEAE